MDQTSEQAPQSEHGYVITIDDVTELVLAQRTSAWADIARRIAHEIKNPLTPISSKRVVSFYQTNRISSNPITARSCAIAR